MHEKLRHWLLGRWARVVAHRPRTILAVAGALVVMSLYVTVTRLGFASNRNDLISPNLAWNQRFIDWQSSFGGSRDLIIVIDAQGHSEQAHQMIDQLGPRLQKRELLEYVVWGFTDDQFSPKAVRLLSMAKFKDKLAELEQATPLLEAANLSDFLARSAGGTGGAGEDGGTGGTGGSGGGIAQFGGFLRTLDRGLDGEESIVFALPDPQWHYLRSANERLYFIRITPHMQPGKLNALAEAINQVQEEMDAVGASYPQLEMGLTGIEVVEAQETEIAIRDSTKASILAVVFITALLMTAFHSVRGPLLAVGALLVGVAWSFGFLTLAIGHLQLISVVFAVILLGLGIDFGLHLVSCFESVRHDYEDTEAGFALALEHSFEVVGPGVITGAITTAAAFMTTMLTDFTGVAEMGLIAGSGIVLCLIAMFSVYPALLRLFKPDHAHFVPMDARNVHLFDPRWISPFTRWPRTTLAIAAVLTLGASVVAATQMRFDYDLLNLQPPGASAVHWSQRIIQDGEESIYFGVSVCDSMAQARQRAEAFAQLDLVQRQLGGVGILIPEDEPQKLAMLQAITLPVQASVSPATVTLEQSLEALNFAMGAAMWMDFSPAMKNELTELKAALLQTISKLKNLSGQEKEDRLRRLDQAFGVYQGKVRQQLTGLLDVSPLSTTDLPEALLRSFEDDQGRLILEIYPKLNKQPQAVQSVLGNVTEGIPDVSQGKLPGGGSPLSPDFLPHFITQMQTVDGDVTGVIVQIFQSGSLIKNAYLKAGGLALLIVFGLVWLDFQKLHDALLCLVPVTVGFSLTFAAMRFVGMQINPANIIVLPLMFGIGVDCGVHVLHRFRQHPDESPPGLTGGTGKGITITSLTTMIGFACMMLAEHRGIRSLGFALSVGVLLTMFACWTVMPAWLTLRQAKSH